MSARFVVALDFGTTFSGAAYARKSHSDDISVLHGWPLQQEATYPYCKTITSLWYVQDSRGQWQCKEWGWPAVIGYCNARMELSTLAKRSHAFSNIWPVQNKSEKEKPYGCLVTRFKLHLSEDGCDVTPLPNGISVERAIEDYLRGMSTFVLAELRNTFGNHVEMWDIEWALTVPAIWTDQAKQKMRKIAKAAGLTPNRPYSFSKKTVQNPLHVILEPEAASAYCHQKEVVDLKIGDKTMVVDAGGGTVDIVVHEKAGNGAEVKEVTRSDGSLCGSTYLDEAAFLFLEEKISCLKDYMKTHPEITPKLMKQWDEIKRCFRNNFNQKVFELPRKLANAWQESHTQDKRGPKICAEEFDEIVFTRDILETIFNPTIEKVLNLIDQQLSSAGACKAILMVGGFSESPYLMHRIKERFATNVTHIVMPPSPGSAICHGAVLQVLHPDCVLSRVSRKTYGTNTTTPFVSGRHPESKKFITSEGEERCHGVFCTFVRIGDVINVSSEVKEFFSPVEPDQIQMPFSIYSSTKKSPEFVDEPGVHKEGSFTLETLDTTLGRERSVEATMWFGRSSIEFKARPVNFGSGEEASTIPIKFEAGELEYHDKK